MPDAKIRPADQALIDQYNARMAKMPKRWRPKSEIDSSVNPVWSEVYSMVVKYRIATGL